MATTTAIPRSLVIFGITLPMALVLGYVLTSPFQLTSFSVISVITFTLVMPALIRYHHTALIFSWYAFITIFFLPGQPYLWMLMSVLSLGFAILNRILDKEARFLQVPAVTYSLLLLALVIVVTAKLRGGIGVRALGSATYGGKGYFYLAFAIAGYFAMTSVQIPTHRAAFFVRLFFLSGITAVMGHLIYFAGPLFYPLYAIFPTDWASIQATGEVMGSAWIRFGGVSAAAVSIYCYMLAQYQIRGIFSLHHPIRMVFFAVVVVASFLGGFRSVLLFFVVIFVVQFYHEGLFRTRLFGWMLLLGLLTYALLIPTITYLPLAFQRTLSFLPGMRVDPLVQFDAQASTDWRIRMWQVMLPELSRYWLLGKGYVINPTELFLARESFKRGWAADFDSALIAGDYHNGPLSLYVPFGSVGVLAFVAFLIAGGRVLRSNLRYGDPSIRNLNMFLLSLYVGRIIFFVLFFGAFSSELFHFTGIVGLSVALNGGVAQPRALEDKPAGSEGNATG